MPNPEQPTPQREPNTDAEVMPQHLHDLDRRLQAALNDDPRFASGLTTPPDLSAVPSDALRERIVPLHEASGMPRPAAIPTLPDLIEAERYLRELQDQPRDLSPAPPAESD